MGRYIVMYEYKVKVVKVVDGDTVDVDIDFGLHVKMVDMRFRLNRIDAYETRLGKKTTPAQKVLGLKAKAYVKEMVKNHPDNVKIVTVRNKKGKSKAGKYGRYLAELYIDNICINDALVSLGLAVYKKY